MATPSRTRNLFLSRRRFVSGALRRSRRLGFLILPAAWIEPGREVSLEVKVLRLTVGWGFWRAQLDLGTFDPIDLDGPVDWERLGVDGYLAWSRRIFGRKWSRMDVERLFRQDPAWRHLAVLGTAHNHYVRVVLARAMMATPDLASLGRNDMLAAATSGDSPESREGSRSSSDGRESFMEGLDQLDRSLGLSGGSGAPENHRAG